MGQAIIDLFEQREVIVGVDVALGMTGLATIDTLNNSVRDLRTIRTAKVKSTPTESARLKQIFDKFMEYLDTMKPTVAVVENQYIGLNKKTGMSLSRVRAVIQLACELKGIPIVLYEPSVVKQIVTGKGDAGKEFVQEAIVELYKEEKIVKQKLSEVITSGKNKTDDMADALALAHTYLSKPEDSTTV